MLKYPDLLTKSIFEQVYNDAINANIPIALKRCLERVLKGKRVFMIRFVNDIRCSYYRGAYRKYVIDICQRTMSKETVLHELVHVCKGNEVDARVIVNKVYGIGFSQTDLLICKNLKFRGRFT